MPVTEQQVIEALRPVHDPELHASIVDLGMVRGVQVDDGHAHVVIALTVAGCPLRDEINRRVADALRPLAGLERLSVEHTVMTADELAAVRARLRGSAGGSFAPDAHAGAGPSARDAHAGHGHGPSAQTPRPLGHEEGRPNPFAHGASRTRVVGITSGKGGVGKSSVTVNLAVALVKAGHSVGLLDADVYGFSVPGMLGVDQEPRVRGDRMVPPEAHGVKTMSIGFFVDDDQPVIWRGPMLHKALEQFLVDVDWDEPDFLLIDMPPGTGDVALSLSQYLPASEIYVVTTPQPAAKRVAQRSAYMARKVNLPLRGVIENMSWFTAPNGSRHEIFGRGGGQELADELGIPLLGQVPLVPEIREGGDRGLPITVADPGCEASAAFGAIAAALVERGRSRVFRPELRIQ
jgi:ATP-binding protein involved in chromosome partitioning